MKMNVAGLKFLYGVTLDRAKVAERVPWPKVPHKKPVILSGTEVEKLLNAVPSLALSANVSETATPVEFTEQGDGVEGHVVEQRSDVS